MAGLISFLLLPLLFYNELAAQLDGQFAGVSGYLNGDAQIGTGKHIVDLRTNTRQNRVTDTHIANASLQCSPYNQQADSLPGGQRLGQLILV